MIGNAFAAMIGPDCEVLLHNPKNPMGSIIWLEGNVTHRQLGGPLTNIGMRALNDDHPPDDMINYKTTFSIKTINFSELKFCAFVTK